MIDWLKDQTLQRKLLLLNGLTASVAGILAAIALIILVWFQETGSAEHRAYTQGAIVAENVLPAIQFQDRKTANEVLRGFSRDASILQAKIIGRDNSLIAFYQVESGPPGMTWASRFWSSLHAPMEVRLPITQAGELLALLELRVDMGDVYRGIVVDVGAVALAIGVSLLIGNSLAIRLQRNITAPLGDLVSLMQSVSESKDYTRRAAVRVDDEIGQIGHNFNLMLEQIHARDLALSHELSERLRAESQLDYLALHDSLTHLPNRFNLLGRLEQAVNQARREQHRIAVMFIDMDRFKNINDTLGHHVGDLLLVEVAQRLRALLRESDIVARLGGDEFVVVVPDVDELSVLNVVEKVVLHLGRPYQIESHELHTTPSIGIALFPGDGDNGESLMKNADMAMYHAKSSGRNNYQFYTQALNEAATERLLIDSGLRQALERGELELHYQPQVEISSEKIVGVEALLRWNHPDTGMVWPSKFIGIAEETGLIKALGDWVLDEALGQLAAWKRMGFNGLRMAVNLSANQLRHDHFPDLIAERLNQHGLGYGGLELEITESVAMQHPDHTAVLLARLRSNGVKLAIDDFGTGYSSLAYLKQLPLDCLKLDRSFVRDIELDSNDAAISAAAISLAHNLGLSVVAEGVETRGQLDFLGELGCDIYQGYHFSKPVSAASMTQLLIAGAQGGREQTPTRSLF